MKRPILVLAALALLLGFGLPAPPACADYTVTLLEQNGNVVATGSGTIDLTDLTFNSSIGGFTSQVDASQGVIQTGLDQQGVDVYNGITGPASFGGGVQAQASSGISGNFVGIEFGAKPPQVIVPHGYVSGNSLSSTATWNGQTFSSLGVTPGTYTWTWGTGAHADSFTLKVEATATPEPASLTLLGIGAVGLFGYCRRQRKRAAA